jgi:hypothetical protein
MEGDLSLVSVPDLLQMICLGRYSRDIHLFDGPTQLGVIAIRNGQVDRCFGFGTWGEAAFYKLVNLRKGRYKVNEAQDTSASDATLTAHSWQELLMEAARMQDEAELAAQQQAATTGRVIAFPSPPPHAPASASSSASISSAAVAAIDAIMFNEPTRESRMPTPSVAAMPSGPISVPPRPINDAPVLSAVPSERSHRVTAEFAIPPDAGPDLTEMLNEATTCYLRRDLARAEQILQQCLVLRPDDKRVLQNLERIRRKKSP